jgi:predicted  nucleic acid-binding Zn-ribbon protein
VALWICTSCTAAYAVGLPACPQCGSSEYEQEHEHMAKISKAGPSYEPGKDPNEPPAEPETTFVGESGPELELPADGAGAAEPQGTEPADGGQAPGEHELPPPPPQHE